MLKSKLNEEEVSDVLWAVEVCFNYFADIRDAQKMADAVLPDVVTDIEKTADNEFNSSDVCMALVRVLKKKLGIEE